MSKEDLKLIRSKISAKDGKIPAEIAEKMDIVVADRINRVFSREE